MFSRRSSTGELLTVVHDEIERTRKEQLRLADMLDRLSTQFSEELAAGVDGLRQELATTRDEHGRVASSVDGLRVELQEVRQELAASREQNAVITHRLDNVGELAAGVDGLRQELATTRDEHGRVANGVDGLRAELQEVRQELAGSREQNAVITYRLDNVGELLSSFHGEIERTREEHLHLAEEFDRLSDRIAGAVADIDGPRRELAVTHEHGQVADVESLQAELQEMRQELATNREDNLAVVHRLNLVNDLVVSVDKLRQELTASREENGGLSASLKGVQLDIERLAIATDDISAVHGYDMPQIAVGTAQRPLRLAVIGSPRSGNSWLRLMLGRYYHLDEQVVDTPGEIGDLSPRSILQIHWPPETDFVAFLGAQGVRPVVIARHPIDVLVSLLHFIRHEPRAARWLGGGAMIPTELVGKSPVSAEFREYCVSEGSANVLAVSCAWWTMRGVIRCHYEDLVNDTEAALRRVRKSISMRGAIPLAEAATSVSIEDMRALSNNHGWQGQPGHWRRLVPPKLASVIHARHREVFEILDYTVDHYRLPIRQALGNWLAVAREPNP